MSLLDGDKMKKALDVTRLIKYLLVIVILVITLFGVISRAKAEGEDDYNWFGTAEPTETFHLFDPETLPTPEPVVTAAPESGTLLESGRSIADAQYQATDLYAATMWGSLGWNDESQSYSYATISYTNINSNQSVGSSNVGYIPAISQTALYQQANFDETSFRLQNIGNSLGTTAGRHRWRLAQKFFQLSITDVPLVELGDGYAVEYTVKFGQFSLRFESDAALYNSLNINLDDIVSKLEGRIICIVHTESGFPVYEESPILTWEQLRSGYTFGYTFGRDNVTSIDIMVIVDAFEAYQYVRSAQIAAVPEGQTFTETFTSIYLESSGSVAQFSRRILVSEKQDDRNWIQKLFVPTQAEMQNLFTNYAGSFDGQGEGTITYFVMNLMDLIYGWTDNGAQRFVFTMPPLSINIQGEEHQFFDGFSFDWGSFWNSSQWRILRNSFWVITDIAFALAFANSLVAIFSRVTGVKIWGGVDEKGDDKK